MALTYTPPGIPGSKLPEFALKTVEGAQWSTQNLSAEVSVFLFICNHCPYVQAIEDRLIQLAHAYSTKHVQFIGICSNDPTDYPEDAPSELLARWRAKNYRFPYLIDTDQSVARAFGAVCTPDIFVYNRERTLSYRGRLDDSWRKPDLVQKQELKLAIEAILQGQNPPVENPSMGCSIKWKSHDSQTPL